MNQPLLDALAERGYDTLTPVQEAVTDPELHAADLLVSAQTGSGKTVGFGLAIGPTLLDGATMAAPAAAPLALIIAPTRELAFQVMRELEWLYAKAGARVVSCVGGMDTRTERRALERGAHIVVGTPGRLRDHITRGALDMTSLRAVVLDEADEMLDLGFREDLEFMLGAAPEDRRTLLFSATVPPMIAKLAKEYQRDAVRVQTVSEKSQHADISYQALRVAHQDAENAIINVLRFHEAQNAIVFANTRATVNRLTARLSNRGFSVVCLSGELSQQERTHALQAMRDGRARVCVATDVAARGIDLPNLELVIHAELPSNAESLLHRSGRTGRAGRKGTSALIVPPKVVKKAERLLKFAKITAEWGTAPSFEDVLQRDEERLLNDPQWAAEIAPDEADFAARLLDLHSPETIAAAYLRLYRARNSAPEELAAPDARPERKERKPFGPSAWFALSVGRDDRAEPRWILPLLCRAGGLDKDAIGAIRVQQSETFVELTEASASGFLSKLGENGVLEDGVTVRRFEGTPGFARQSESAPSRKPAHKAPYKGDKRGSDKPRGPAPERHQSGAESRAPKPAPKPKPAPVDPEVHAPAKPRSKPAGKPVAKHDGDGAKRGFDKPGKPAHKGGGKPGGKFGGKPAGKPGGGKPSGGKPSGSKPAGPRPGASDTSKRFAPPKGAGRGKPGKRTGNGMQSPTRRKP
ncbi:DEAD/DEAH box helicase [Marinovum sp. 2_MG-2023]|uniref:DEAD/DEAH box helicase n=1 Tax=unclassified Marinovum TaxID=2647166 RepID=UPI0026E46F90|nr:MULTISPECIES: DEAD/DEAH box helicase [unclassified Marinovum]MDO6730182.1 DEAD/DEAH box helicase [Marinovum sp. 2_MG-2023]MDO6778920.1 DEAD/DEAH box helicase [Marinovum sp. 1_MG-2023]